MILPERTVISGRAYGGREGIFGCFKYSLEVLHLSPVTLIETKSPESLWDQLQLIAPKLFGTHHCGTFNSIVLESLRLVNGLLRLSIGD